MDDMSKVRKVLTRDEVKKVIEEAFDVKVTWMSDFKYCMKRLEFKDDSWATRTFGMRTIDDDEIVRRYFGEPDNHYQYTGIFRDFGLLAFDNPVDLNDFILALQPENTNRGGLCL